MTAKRDLRIEVRSDQIVVSLPRSLYRVTYRKPANSLQLLAENIPDKEDRYAPMKLADFLAKAWKLANDKARELGWIKYRKKRRVLLSGRCYRYFNIFLSTSCS
jgi:hypothetical protein